MAIKDTSNMRLDIKEYLDNSLASTIDKKVALTQLLGELDGTGGSFTITHKNTTIVTSITTNLLH